MTIVCRAFNLYSVVVEADNSLHMPKKARDVCTIMVVIVMQIWLGIWALSLTLYLVFSKTKVKEPLPVDLKFEEGWVRAMMITILALDFANQLFWTLLLALRHRRILFAPTHLPPCRSANKHQLLATRGQTGQGGSSRY